MTTVTKAEAIRLAAQYVVDHPGLKCESIPVECRLSPCEYSGSNIWSLIFLDTVDPQIGPLDAGITILKVAADTGEVSVFDVM